MMRESTELQNWRWDKRLPEYGAVSEKEAYMFRFVKSERVSLFVDQVPPVDIGAAAGASVAAGG